MKKQLELPQDDRPLGERRADLLNPKPKVKTKPKVKAKPAKEG